jgi:6-pyruvoyltetrahydropterin/6-carboxytetrahydropterin synthase
MQTASKDFTFEAAHRLQKHAGECRNLHGHTYKVRVTITAGCLDAMDMIMDFSHIKKIVWNEVLSGYDHCTILEISDPLYDLLKGEDIKVMPYNCSPTAEAMSMYIFNQITFALKGCGVQLVSVIVWETPDNFATMEATK